MLHLFILDDAVHLGLPALIPEAENLIRDGVVIVLLAEHPVNGIDYHLFQKRFIDCPVVAGVAGGLQAAAAPPDDGLAASVVPVDTPVKLAALATENDLRETVLAGVAAPFAVVAGVDHAPADQLLLHQKEDVLRDDGLVVAFHIVLRDGAVVFDALLRQKICGVSLLQERVTDVLLVAENLVDGAGVPFCFASAGEDAVSHKPVCNLIHTKGKNRCVSRQKHALINSRERPRKSDINLEQSSHVEALTLMVREPQSGSKQHQK